MPLNTTITNEQKITGCSITPTTTSGRPAQIDGSVSVSVVSGDSTATVTGPLTFDVISSDTPGDTTFLVEADADLGAGVVTIQDTITLTVSGAQAANVGLTLGTVGNK